MHLAGFIFFLLFIGVTSDAWRDLYKDLGLRRGADSKEIKSAYKKLARKWHPDHNKEPEAKDKFLQIQKAYEVLSDDERRGDYDYHGIIDKKPQGEQRGPSHFQHHHDMFGWRFHRQNPPISSDTHRLGSHNWRIYVEGNGLHEREGGYNAFLIHFFHDQSQRCRELSPQWEAAAKSLGGTVHTGRVNAAHEPGLCRRLGISHVPAFVLFLENGSENIKYTDTHYGIEKLAQWAVSHLPHGIVELQTSEEHDKWIAMDPHRVKVLIFSDKRYVSVLHAQLQLEFKPYIDFAIVRDSLRPSLSKQYDVKSIPSFVIMKDEKDIVNIKAKGLSKSQLRSLLSYHKIPRVTRLTRDNFDGACKDRAGVEVCLVIATAAKGEALQNLLADARRLSSEINGKFGVAWVDASEQKKWLACYGVGSLSSGLSTLIMMKTDEQYHFQTYSMPTLENAISTATAQFESNGHGDDMWTHTKCSEIPPLQVPIDYWSYLDPMEAYKKIYRLAKYHNLEDFAPTAMYFIAPIIIMILFMNNVPEDSKPTGKAPRKNPGAAPQQRGGPQHRKHEPKELLPMVPRLQGSDLEKSGYTVLVFVHNHMFPEAIGVVEEMVAQKSNDARYSFVKLDYVAYKPWWMEFNVDRDKCLPTLIAIRGKSRKFCAMPWNTDMKFNECVKSWLGRLEDGSGDFQKVEQWP